MESRKVLLGKHLNLRAENIFARVYFLYELLKYRLLYCPGIILVVCQIENDKINERKVDFDRGL